MTSIVLPFPDVTETQARPNLLVLAPLFSIMPLRFVQAAQGANSLVMFVDSDSLLLGLLQFTSWPMNTGGGFSWEGVWSCFNRLALFGS